MKKSLSLLTVILLIILATHGSMPNLAKASVWATDWPWSPIMTPPSISISLPVQNAIYNSTSVSLNLTVSKPADWFGPDSGNYTVEYVFGKIKCVYYSLDDGKNQSKIVDEGHLYYSEIPAQRTFSFSFPLNLTSGKHSVTVGVKAETYYVVNPFSYPASVEVQGYSDTINFTVQLLNPIILAPDRTIFNDTNVPLQFALENLPSLSWIGYSLDGTGNITITGNTTLTGLSNGEHNVTLFANDTFGNIVASQLVRFTVALPVVTKPFPTALLSIVSVILFVALIPCLLLYRRYRKTTEKLSQVI